MEITGSSGADTINGTTSADIIRSLEGNDLVNGLDGDDDIFGGRGNDTLLGGNGSDFLNGDGQNNPLSQDGNDTLLGGSGSDILFGSGGNDILDGFGFTNGSQVDRLQGSFGSDTFVLGSGGAFSQVYYTDFNQFARIEDFRVTSDSLGDKIQIRGSTSEYTLRQNRNLFGDPGVDTEILRNGNLIGVVEDTTDVSFARDFISV